MEGEGGGWMGRMMEEEQDGIVGWRRREKVEPNK